MKTTQKNEDDLKNKDDLKNGDDLNNEDDTKMSTTLTVLPEKFVDDFSLWHAQQTWLQIGNILRCLNRKKNLMKYVPAF